MNYSPVVEVISAGLLCPRSKVTEGECMPFLLPYLICIYSLKHSLYLGHSMNLLCFSLIFTSPGGKTQCTKQATVTPQIAM